MTAKSPAFQFYPKDWLSSRKIMMMPPEYEGAYIRLLCYCWDSGDCSLPDDDVELAVLSRLGEGWFKGGSTAVRKCFVPHPKKPGFLTHEKLLEEHLKQSAWRAKSALGGKRSAAQRAGKPGQSKGGSTKPQPSTPPPVEPKGNSSTATAYCIREEETDRSVSNGTEVKGDFQRIFEVGCEVFPNLAPQNTSAIHSWLSAGCDVDRDILPEIRRMAGQRPRGWGFFSQGISDAKARRESPLPSPRAGPSPFTATPKFDQQAIINEIFSHVPEPE